MLSRIRTLQLIDKVTKIAITVFGNNLLLTFIGGSYAKGTNKVDSDIDIFVILKRSDMVSEKIFAHSIKNLHHENGLKFSHCGEVFDRATIDRLINYTVEFLKLLPEIQNVGCYHGDCIFSIFRKGDVVLKFLLDDKKNLYGDKSYLENLIKIANSFFLNFPMKRIQLEKNNLKINDKIIDGYEKKLSAMAKSEDFFATPVGIGLERWFSEENMSLIPLSFTESSLTQEINCKLKKNECPLQYYPSNSLKGKLYRNQCLAIKLTQTGENDDTFV